MLHASGQSPKILTAEANEALGQRIETEMSGNNTQIFADLFDKREFLKLTAGNGDAAEMMFYQAFTEKFDLQKLAAQSLANFGAGSYRLLRSYQKNGQYRLIFRLFGAAGINYHDFIVLEEDDSLKLSDVFVYTLGETMSEYFAHTGRIVLATADNGADAMDDAKDVLLVNSLMEQQNYAAVLNLLETSTSQLLKYPVLQQYHIRASKQLGDSAYAASLERFNRLYPNAPNGFLYQIDACYLTKEYAKGLLAVDKLDSSVSGDPYLDLFRANLYYVWGKLSESVEASGRLFAADPLMSANTRLLISRLMAAENVATARTIFSKYQAIPAHDKDLVAGLIADYPELESDDK